MNLPIPMTDVVSDKFKNFKRMMETMEKTGNNAIIEFPGGREISVQKNNVTRELDHFIKNDNTNLEFILISKVVKGNLKVVVFPDPDTYTRCSFRQRGVYVLLRPE